MFKNVLEIKDNCVLNLITEVQRKADQQIMFLFFISKYLSPRKTHPLIVEIVEILEDH